MSFKQFYNESKSEPKEYSEKELKARQDKKTNAIKTLQKNIRSLKMKVASDLKSDDERTKLIALAISLMIKTRERIGNDNSANGLRKDENGDMVQGEKHYGITGLRSKHVSFKDGNAILKYTAKSGVKQEKVIKDSNLVALLKQYTKQNGGFIFTTSNDLKIKSTMVNNYLKNFDITGKDIRAFGGNDEIIRKLKSHNIPKEESERKKLFLDIAQEVADLLGHSRTMLRNAYLRPDLEEQYITKGNIISLG